CALPISLISFKTPSLGAGTSSTTLSVSKSTRFSSRRTSSPAFLCQLTSVASVTDSGSCGTLTSMLTGPLRRSSTLRERRSPLARIGRERGGHERLLLTHVQRVDARRRRRRARTAGVEQLMLVGQRFLETVADRIPRGLVLQFFLTPYALRRVRIAADRPRILFNRERVELLDAHNCDTVELLGATSLDELVVDLAAAEHDSLHVLRFDRVGLADQRLKAPARELLERRDRETVPQQALRRQHAQRLAQRAEHLAPQQVEHLR